MLETIIIICHGSLCLEVRSPPSCSSGSKRGRVRTLQQDGDKFGKYTFLVYIWRARPRHRKVMWISHKSWHCRTQMQEGTSYSRPPNNKLVLNEHYLVLGLSCASIRITWIIPFLHKSAAEPIIIYNINVILIKGAPLITTLYREVDCLSLSMWSELSVCRIEIGKPSLPIAYGR